MLKKHKKAYARSPQKNDNQGGIVQNARKLMKITTLVDKLVAAKVAQQANDTKFLWDIIPPVARLMVLNQFRTTWNVTEKLVSNLTRLEWSSLPGDIQKSLLDQKASYSFLNLTFLNWGIVNLPTDLFANTTLLSLISKEFQVLFPVLKVSLDKISYDNILNVTLLRQGFPNVFMMIGEMLHEFNLPPPPPPSPLRRFKKQALLGHRGPKLPPPPTPFDVFYKAVMNAAIIVKQSGISMRPF